MTQTKTSEQRIPVAGYFVGIGFLMTAGALLATSSSGDIPLVEKPAVRAEQITPGVYRVAMTDPPIINIGSYDMRCNDCHFVDMGIRQTDRDLVQHADIKLNHGTNDSCLNCHDQNDREKLTLRNGGLVGYDQVESLCAQCHGPIHRDWEQGSHGKTIGYWDTNLGEAEKFSCADCHDPHSPTYDPMPPLPGPNTLRMGDQHSGHGSLIDDRNPLQRWRLSEDGSGDHGNGKGGDH